MRTQTIFMCCSLMILSTGCLPILGAIVASDAIDKEHQTKHRNADLKEKEIENNRIDIEFRHEENMRRIRMQEKLLKQNLSADSGINIIRQEPF